MPNCAYYLQFGMLHVSSPLSNWVNDDLPKNCLNVAMSKPLKLGKFNYGCV